VTALDHLQSILGQQAITTPAFPPESRYHTVPLATVLLADGRQATYLRRRFVPAPERFVAVGERSIVQGDRPDLLANELFGAPELFWRLCDANGVLRPDDLVAVVGSVIRVTLPEGIPGGGGA
jgi:hypothetical protein